jgi:hypothetical protein
MTRRNCLYPGLALTTLAALCLAIRVVPARAAGPGQGRHLGEEKKSHGDEGEQGEQVRGKGHRGYQFEAREREIISGYYAKPSQGLPPGLAKRGGNLPPGLEKQLVRNGTLPPGLQKRLEPLPVELERQLPALPTDCGCRRGIIGTDVVLVRTGNNFILDVLHISGR